MQDFTKTAATLASGLLVLTVTFAEKVIGKADDVEGTFLVITWALLVLAILFSILATGSLRNHLLDKEKGITVPAPGVTPSQEQKKMRKRARNAVFFANLCFFCLLFAGIGFLIVGERRLAQKPADSPAVLVTRVREQIKGFGYAGTWTLQSFSRDQGDTIQLRFEAPTDTLQVRVRGSDEKIINFSRSSNEGAY